MNKLRKIVACWHLPIARPTTDPMPDLPAAAATHARCSPLLTDLYQLTMACGYWRTGIARHEAVFHLGFRKSPFGGGYTVAGGLGTAIEQIRGLRYERDELDYLADLRGNDENALFDRAFLDTLAGWEFACDVDAVPEGTLVFPHEPLLRVQGPLWQAQLLETALLNTINFQSLVATKAARVCQSAAGEPVLEFGLRRAQGPDGATTASRAAYLGGCAATSNVLAGFLYGIPVRGTHAHSWVMAYASEIEAFDAYAGALPNNVVFLVDTYDTLAGVRHAVEAGTRLRDRGFRLAGIRLDSGDLAYLSIEARKILDAAGFAQTAILATNDLDEHLIASLKEQGAKINTWAVGTQLVTAYDQPALGGVYKLSALRENEQARWQYKIKLSEQTIKVSTPGILQVRRFRQGNEWVGDMIYDLGGGEPGRIIVDPGDGERRKDVGGSAEGEDLLVPVFRGGRLVHDVPPLAKSRERVAAQLAGMHPGIKRFLNPHAYPAGLSENLHELKTRSIREARAGVGKEKPAR